ncbi:hypothetical protein [Reichenbachiella versicolor]|uniref:hypothetical protein n=1 Tax=Reichenbachiella versicolor TaxID=1821036 RepID=UPI000D6DDE09|nr:hypothetical protein [Reichenbachiella versicolor]
MKTLYRFNHILITIVALFAILAAQAGEFSREFTDSKKVSNSDLMKIVTSHCKDLNIITTDKKEAKIVVTLTLDLDDAKLAEEVFQNVEYKIETTSEGVKMDVSSPFKSFTSSGSFWGSNYAKVVFKNGHKMDFNDDLEFDLRAKVYIPKSNKMSLDASHSNAELGFLSNSAEIKVSHSHLKASDMKELIIKSSHSQTRVGNIEKDASMKMSHSRFNGLKIGGMTLSAQHSILNLDMVSGNVKVNMQHSTLEMEDAGNIEVSSLQHSTLRAENVKNIEANTIQHSSLIMENAGDVQVDGTQHSKIRLENILSLRVGGGSHSNISVEEITDAVVISASHSNISVEDLGENIKVVKVKNSHASVSLGTGNVKNMDVYINDGKFTNVRNEGDLEKKSDGFYKKRSGSGDAIEVTINCPFCNVNL